VTTLKKASLLTLILVLVSIASLLARVKWGYGFHEGI
jgi:hypothetical protein